MNQRPKHRTETTKLLEENTEEVLTLDLTKISQL